MFKEKVSPEEKICNKIIGKNIRFFRERCFIMKTRKGSKNHLTSCLTQTQLARKIDVSCQQLQKYEKGSNRISIYKLLKLCEFFKVPIKYFTDPETTNKIPYTRNLYERLQYNSNEDNINN